MKRKTLFIMLLVALFVPLAMNAQAKSAKKSATGSAQPKLEVKLADKAMTSNRMISRLESSKEAALEELNGRGVRATGDYELITAAQSNWSGEYVLAYRASNTQARVMTGRAGTSTNTYGTGTLFTMSNNTLASSDVDSYKMTIAQDGNYYTIKFGNYYLGAKNGNYLLFSTTTPTQDTYRWTIAYSNNTLTITNASYNTRQIKWNSASNGQRFACYTSGQQNISLFKKSDGCSAPTNFAATNVTTNSVTLSWTETGTSEEWAILYMSEEDTEAQVEFVETNPYTLTGLNPNTYYIAEVIPMCGDYDQESDVIEFTTEDLPCPQPTNLNVTAMTPSSATVSWSGEADSYTLQYRPAADNGEAALYDDFEDAWLDDFGDWTLYTQGDQFSGYGWFAYSPDDFMGEYSPGAHSGSVCAMAVSYGSTGALNANNYLVTPQVELGGTLKFWMWGDYEDEYEVLLSTGGNAISDFTVTLQAMQAAPYNTWGEISIDLSRYAGQQGYIAIHHEMYDGDVIMLDDFAIYGDAQPAGAWETIENVTSPYTITGLDGETTYEWQVQGDCGADGESLWSAIGTFTTPSTCGTPTGLTTTDITNNSATLSWAAALDAYNVRYRKGFVYDFESAEPWTYTNFAPCTTYDGDGGDTYYFQTGTFPNQGYVGACIAFQNGFNTNMVSHDGNAFGVMFNQAGATDDWFILPELTIEEGDVFSFWTREITDQYGDEIINVGVCGSTDGTFSSYLVRDYGVSATDWTELSYDLSSYAGQTIRLAINCVSNDIFGLMIDDIFVGNPSNDWSTPVAVNGSTYALTGLDMETSYTWQVQGVDCDGEGATTSWASDYFTTLDGILVESISADDVTVTIGETATITNLEVLPDDATNPAVTYTSNDETIATVENGVVTGVTPGTTTITIAATDGSGVTYDITVTVNGIDVTGITASDITMITGETATISYTVTPDDATDQSVTFTSANTAIATVDADGVVTGVGAGETTITIASVSNPDVTTEITVTVTSNPNAAQFTVNAPANAAPGDVITVEGVLTAPTSGTYDGFNGLILDLEYDNTAFAYVNNSMVYGSVAQAAQQMGGFLFPGTLDNAVQLAISVFNEGSFVTAEGVVFSAQFTVLEGTEGSFEFTAKPHITSGSPNFDHEGTAILYEVTPSTVNISTMESYTKHIIGWDSEEGNGYNYYLIASPLANDVDPADVTDMLSNSYDLYYFDQAGDANGNEWINYKDTDNGGGYSLTNGKGYLYANSNTVDLVFTGTALTGQEELPVTLEVKDCSNASGHFVGWNLVGNPFAQTAFIDRDCYVMNSNGNEIVTADSRKIESMQGIFVIAETDGEEVTFSTREPQTPNSKVVMNVIGDQGLADRAIVRFGEGSQLPKLQLFGNSTKVYFTEDDQDYAVVRSANENELPVNFRASSNGSYTMSVEVEDLDMEYLHLIDNLTGMDVDLLQTPSYTFEATTSDSESRFRLVFATVDGVSENGFGFVNASGSFCIFGIEGEATVQVIDVLGHVLSSEQFSGSYEKHLDVVPGVYMIRLIQGNDIRVQKTVVR